jgi:hypothetical protein
MMNSTVLRSVSAQVEIVDVVIIPVAVDVMDVFTAAQRSPQMLLHDGNVLVNRSASAVVVLPPDDLASGVSAG